MSHMGVQDSQDIVVSSHISISENTTKLMDKVGMGIRLQRLLSHSIFDAVDGLHAYLLIILRKL